MAPVVNLECLHSRDPLLSCFRYTNILLYHSGERTSPILTYTSDYDSFKEKSSWGSNLLTCIVLIVGL